MENSRLRQLLRATGYICELILFPKNQENRDSCDLFQIPVQLKSTNSVVGPA